MRLIPPPWNVEVAVVEAKSPDDPASERSVDGEVVPIPTRPPLLMTKYVALVEPTVNAGPVMPFGFTESMPHGVVEPTPRKPAEVIVVVPVWPAAKVLVRWEAVKNVVVVAFVVVELDVVRPPLNASCVEVALFANG